jgi:hypothetical protein
MRAAGDVEHEAVGRIEANERRVAIAPVGDCFEQAPIGMRIGVCHSDPRIHCARVGKRHAWLEAKPRGRIIDGRKPQCALDLGGDDERRINRCVRVLPRDPVGRKPSQPDR